MAGRAIFWTDASVSIGGGHVRRCLSLADALSKAGWQCWFAVGEEALVTAPMLARAGYRHVIVRAADDFASFERIAAEGCDLLVIDHYGLDAAFESACRSWAKCIVVIDDLANRSHDCDLLLDQTAGRTAEDYVGLAPAHCRFLMGTHYALLPLAFAERRLAGREAGGVGGSRRVIVSFGLVDRDNATALALTALSATHLENVAVDVVIGAAGPHKSMLREIAAAHPMKVAIHLDVDDMSALMNGADLAIGAAGISSWERCCLGLPSIVVTVADNQCANADVLEKKGAALVLGALKDVTKTNFAHAIQALLEDPARRLAMSKAAASICDGRGANRVARVIAQMVEL